MHLHAIIHAMHFHYNKDKLPNGKGSTSSPRHPCVNASASLGAPHLLLREVVHVADGRHVLSSAAPSLSPAGTLPRGAYQCMLSVCLSACLPACLPACLSILSTRGRPYEVTSLWSSLYSEGVKFDKIREHPEIQLLDLPGRESLGKSDEAALRESGAGWARGGALLRHPQQLVHGLLLAADGAALCAGKLPCLIFVV